MVLMVVVVVVVGGGFVPTYCSITVSPNYQRPCGKICGKIEKSACRLRPQHCLELADHVKKLDIKEKDGPRERERRHFVLSYICYDGTDMTMCGLTVIEQ